MSDMDEFMQEFGPATTKGRREWSRHNGQCEALTGSGARCAYTATCKRDGRRVCRQHRCVDWPLKFVEEGKS